MLCYTSGDMVTIFQSRHPQNIFVQTTVKSRNIKRGQGISRTCKVRSENRLTLENLRFLKALGFKVKR